MVCWARYEANGNMYWVWQRKEEAKLNIRERQSRRGRMESTEKNIWGLVKQNSKSRYIMLYTHRAKFKRTL